MKARSQAQQLAAITLSLGILACATIPKMLQTPAPSLTPTVTLTLTPSVTPTPSYKVDRGESLVFDSGGYKFARVRGFEVLDQSAIGIYISSADTKLDVFTFAFARPSGSTISGLLNLFLKDLDSSYGDFIHTDLTRDSAAGYDSIYSEFTGIDSGEAVKGHVRVYEPQDSKIVYLLVLAHGDQRWDREGQRVLDLTLSSMEFFDIKARDDCPVSHSHDYGWDKVRPIKIGSASESGPTRIENYLSSLLGAKGELVSYDRDANSKDYDRIQKYYLRIGNSYKTLYFDTTEYEELQVPFGLTCSSLPPGPP